MCWFPGIESHRLRSGYQLSGDNWSQRTHLYFLTGCQWLLWNWLLKPRSHRNRARSVTTRSCSSSGGCEKHDENWKQRLFCLQNKSFTFWKILVAAIRHSFYFEGERSTFPVCFAVFPSFITAQWGTGSWSGNKRFSIETNCCRWSLNAL